MVFGNEENEQLYKYDGAFSGSILIVGQSGCGKTAFVQNLARNKMFENLKSVDWISKIKLSKSMEIDISLGFSQTNVEYQYPEDISDFNVIIESFQCETVDEKDETDFDIIGEKKSFINLLSWTTSQFWLINQTNLAVF